MMFNEQARNSCISESMRVKSSTPDIISRNLAIQFDNLESSKI